MTMTGTGRSTALAERLMVLEVEREQLQARIDGLRAELAGQLEPGATAADRYGRPLYTLRPGKRTFVKDLARDRLPDAVWSACLVETIDGGAVKRLSPALWEDCCQVGDPYLQAVRS